ncbi:MAG: alpha/beta hydrolase [Sedimenticola thiotaurini]|uniref:Alpha/beta hydrolase n=1 Tax=Sedimenticola thiotaurini TaxID=1543721 RepID=A0A558D2B4_9GAMM|nr:MAG: alpha/beta hydrolase [Sedimenticola thiotaurini]
MPKLFTVTEQKLITRWIELSTLQCGSGSSRKVLALHGWLDNAASFLPLAPLLNDLELVALDLPGHGHSDHRPPGQHYHFVDFVEDVIGAADELGWGQFILLGHSMGAGIASLIAASFPERIEKLILIEGLGPWGDNPAEAPRHLAEATRQILSLNTKRTQHYRREEDAVAARMKAGDLGEHSAQLLVSRNTIKDDQGISWRTDPRLRLRSPIYLTEEQAQAFLTNIAAPTLFIRDVKREVPSHYNWDVREKLIKELQIVALSGGHHLHMENPQAVANTINKFLEN